MQHRVFNFTGGLQLRTNPFLVASNELIRAQNVVLYPLGSISKRDGYTQIGSAIVATKSILGNFEYQYGTTPTRKHIVVVNDSSDTNADIFVNVGGTWTIQTGAGADLTASAKCRMATFLDYCFLVNYSDATRSYNGTAWSTSTNVTSAPKAKFIETYRNRVYLGYTDVGGTAYPSTIFYSSLPTAGAITWDTTYDWFYVETDDGDAITGLSKNFEHLIIFKERSMFRYDGTFNATNLVPISRAIGAVSQESIVRKDNFIFFYSLQGPAVYDGNAPQLIGKNIQEILNRVNASNYSDICAGVDGDHIYWYVGTLTSALDGDSSALTNVIIDFDMAANAWTYHTIPDAPKAFATITSSGAKVLSFGDSNGEVFTWNSGTTDDGTAITTNVETKLWVSPPDTNNNFRKIYTFGSSDLSSLDWQYSVDDATFSTADALATGKFNQFGSSAFGKQLEIRFTENDSATNWRLDGFTVDFDRGELDIQEAA